MSERGGMPGDEDAVAVVRAGGIMTVTIDRPDALNALSEGVLRRLVDAVAAIADDDGVRGVILTGAGGRAFAAGADIRAMRDFSPADAARVGRLGHELAAAIEGLDVPVVAGVDGVALGGGCELALACDLVYATASSRFGQPEVRLGLIPGFGGTVRLPRAIGLARAKELILSGRIVDATEALEIGLVSRLFPNREALLAGAAETLELIARNGRTAVALAKHVLVEAAGADTATAAEIELAGFERAFAGAEHEEGLAAFLEKREPRF